MNPFAPGLREIARKLQRQFVRRRLAARQRELEKAEADLGLLGWQQADFDPDTQRQVSEIQNVEREQARISNDAATFGLLIQRLQQEHAAARREYEGARAPLDAERRRLLAPYEVAERQLAEKRKSEPNFQIRIPQLDRELRDVTRRYGELLTAQPQTPQIRQELQRLRERTVTIPNEKSEMRMQHLRITTEIRELEEALAREGEALTAVDAQLQQLEEVWKQRDESLSQQIADAQREKAHAEKHIDDLESAKANPYLHIGQVLADNNIAPMNQPQALEKVKQLRLAAAEFEQALLESEALTAQEDLAVLKRSYFILAATLGAGLFVLLLIATW